MNAQVKQNDCHVDTLMNDSAPGTTVWLIAYKKTQRIDIAFGADKSYTPGTIKNHFHGAGLAIAQAIWQAIPEDKNYFTSTVDYVSLKLIKDCEGRWHTLSSAVDYE